MNLNDYFSFTQGEKRGIVFFLSIIFLLLLSFPLLDLLKKNEKPDFSEFETAINAFEKAKEETQPTNNFKQEENTPENIELFSFNPNTITDEEWKKLGFKDRQIKTINNYKAKGGSWKTKSDVLRIYGIDTAHYEQLKSFILLPEKMEHQQKSFSDYEKKDFPKSEYEKKDYTFKVDINTADTTELKKLKGIGIGYAKRIIKYREELGGFINTNQLNEVWGLPPETLEKCLPQVIISNQNIKKININTASAEELKKHPYIFWKTANAIEKYRKANGNYKSLEDLKKIHLLDEETINKIKSYLEL
ncbi:MAG: helix-hairpin-helix domain-containing protein [Vicingaceae bacterium]|nr:helix-hairpin-helix domain-containing protein [Vicingaceae bacterium]